MILVTVGMQLGFDRLIEAMDSLAPQMDMPVIAQTGKGGYAPKNMVVRTSIAPDEFDRLVATCRVIVSHAGIGTVLTAARHSKPIVLMPRRAELGEHRNDHQIATVENLQDRPGIFIAETEADLSTRISTALRHVAVSHHASTQSAKLNQTLAQFIETGAL